MTNSFFSHIEMALSFPDQSDNNTYLTVLHGYLKQEGSREYL